MNSRTGRTGSAICALLAALTLAACSPAVGPTTGPTASAPKITARPAPDEFSVMTWNLDRFSFDDRNKDGRPAEFKPEPEVQALLETIAAEKPDILACQELGDGPALQRLRDELQKRGLDYAHTEQLVLPPNTAHLAILSRHPILATTRITNETYTIQGRSFPVLHGFLLTEIEVDSRYRFKLLTAHLRGKEFNEAGQTEMRRNEARLLNKTVRHLLDSDPTNRNLLVLGTLNDQPRSAALKEILGKDDRPILADLRPLDPAGQSWTRHNPEEDAYERHDYILASADLMNEAVTPKCHIAHTSSAPRPSDHRPLTAVFRTRDL